MSIISTQMSSSIKNGSWIRRMFEAGIQLKQKYGDDAVCDFSLGNPDLAPPPAVGKALAEFVKHVDEPFSLGYMPNNGFGWAREKLAAHLSKEQGVELTANDVILTCGAAGALNVIFRTVLEPGDEVLTVTPYFVEYGSYVGNHGGTLKKVPTLPGTFGLDLLAIEAAITPKTRAMIINSPHNPTGTVYSREELEGLTAILAKASERNGRPLYLVVDEPYRFLAFDGVEVPSLLPMYPYAVLASSFSKNLCLAGERVGFIALSPLFAERAELMGGLTLANRILGFVNPPVVGQHIMAGALGSQVDVNIYARRREMMGNVLSDAGYEFQMPKGAFYFFPKAPGGDDVAFVNKLLDERILAVPGSGFGGPGLPPGVLRRGRGHRPLRRRLQAGPRVGKPFRAARQPPVSRGTREKVHRAQPLHGCPVDGFRPAGGIISPAWQSAYLSIPFPQTPAGWLRLSPVFHHLSKKHAVSRAS